MRFRPGPRNRGERLGFTLLEVLVAFAIFMIAIFGILGLTIQSLNSARQLKHSEPDIGNLAAALSMTNLVGEGDLPIEVTRQFEDLYPGFRASGEITEVGTNGLFRADIQIDGARNRGGPDSTLSILLFRPGSPLRVGNRPSP